MHRPLRLTLGWPGRVWGWNLAKQQATCVNYASAKWSQPCSLPGLPLQLDPSLVPAEAPFTYVVFLAYFAWTSAENRLRRNHGDCKAASFLMSSLKCTFRHGHSSADLLQDLRSSFIMTRLKEPAVMKRDGWKSCSIGLLPDLILTQPLPFHMSYWTYFS